MEWRSQAALGKSLQVDFSTFWAVDTLKGRLGSCGREALLQLQTSVLAAKLRYWYAGVGGKQRGGEGGGVPK